MEIIKPYYQEDGITIYNADCRDVLPQLPQVDLVLTDPPYGINIYRNGTMGTGVKAKQSSYDIVMWDKNPIKQKLLNEIIGKGKYAIVWGGNYYPMPPSSCWLVWDKLNGGNKFADCELAWTNLKIAVRIKRHLWNGMLREGNETRKHPVQKPLKVILWAASLAPNWDTCLDPFMGSGTILVAAKNLKRQAIGIELEKKYCDIAIDRLRQGVLDL